MAISKGYVGLVLLRGCCGLVRFVRSRKHLLNTLIRLEYIILRVFWLLGSCLPRRGGDGYFVLYFLTLAACEGALGLSVLVRLVRTHGSDNLNRLNSLIC